MTTTKAPPSPPASSGSGHSADFDRDPLQFLTRCAREYGDVVRLQFDQPVYLLSRADLVEEVVQGKSGIFLKELQSATLRGGHNPQALKYEAFRGILGQNVLTADGED